MERCRRCPGHTSWADVIACHSRPLSASERGDRRPSYVRPSCPRGWALAGVKLGDTVVVWSYRVHSGYPVGLAVAHVEQLRSLKASGVSQWEAFKMLKKPSKGSGTLPAIPSVGWDEWSRQLPNLYAFLTQTEWDEGEVRETGALLIFSDAGALKAMLKDKDQGRCLWVTGSSLKQLLEVADAKVIDDHADWREDKQAGKKKAGR